MLMKLLYTSGLNFLSPLFVFIKAKFRLGNIFCFYGTWIFEQKIQFSYIHKLNLHLQITSLKHTRFSHEKLFYIYIIFWQTNYFYVESYPLFTSSRLIEFFHKNPWNALSMRVLSCFIAGSKHLFFSYYHPLFSVFGFIICIYEHKIDVFTLIEYSSTQ